MVQSQTALWTCSACLRAQFPRRALLAQPQQWRAFAISAVQAEQQSNKPTQASQDARTGKEEEEKGAMSRRLADMAEETMDTGSKSDRKMMADAGFSDELKKQLEERIAQSVFNVENQQIISQATMPSSAGKGTRDQAAAPVWGGEESLHDAALRMLDDSHKRIRTPARKPTLNPTVNLRPKPKQKVSVADRLVNARDKTSIYTMRSEENMSEEERERFRKELKSRFEPGARPMPTTLQGLTSLANERIEDAIARGQFRNIQRGKGVNIERDYTASSPFINTTEHFMNKIIQRQDIVPPWIEKQQELLKLVNTFRNRLRNDWRRHAARTISSKGGSLADQMRKAKAFALAEEKHNPRPLTKSESMSGIDPTGMLTTVTIEERIAAGVAPDQGPEATEIKITETVPAEEVQGTVQVAKEAEVIAEDTVIVSTVTVPEGQVSLQSDDAATQVTTSQATPSAESAVPAAKPPPTASSLHVAPMAYPFRDPNWERIENAYHKLAIEEINATARSYNLMAPKIAQKPYYTLTRELNKCFADVAPTLADEILTRSQKGTVKIQIAMHKQGSVLEKFQGTGHVAKVRDEPQARGYGFKEFWKDLFSKDEDGRRKDPA
jgi:hypothetical protein